MYFPQFLVGMFATSFIVAIWAAMETGSVWKALGWAVLALIVLQVGYIGLVLGLIYGRGSKGAEADLAATNSMPALRGELGKILQRWNRARPR